MRTFSSIVGPTMFSVIPVLFCLCLSICNGYFSLEVGDPCPTRNYHSNCQPAEQCATIGKYIDSGKLSVDAVVNCGYTIKGEKICCPLEVEHHPVTDRISNQITTTRLTAATTTTTQATTTTTTTTEATTTTTTTSTTTTTEAPSWLAIFKTHHDYTLPSVEINAPFSRDELVFPGANTQNKAACQAPLYEGICLGISECASLEPLLKQQRVSDIDVQTCRSGTIEEIICCPTSLKLQPRGQIETYLRVGSQQTQSQQVEEQDQYQNNTGDVQLLSHYKHLAALAYPNAAFDGHVHRCTAVALTSHLLLTVAGCGRPSHAVFGVADMREVDTDEDYLVDIRNVAVHRQDLELLHLQRPLEIGPQLKLAPICTHFELTRLQVSGQLLATAWAKGNDSDCPFYELPMRLLPFDGCKNIDNVAGVQNLPTAHLCLEPINLGELAANKSSSCAPCPAVVGSVLHLRRPNGDRCVLGIATPTGANCDAQAMYFTSVLDTHLYDFVARQQH
ncbi:uncharacterized protein LOC6565398 [Drosophila grimshawi]|uniref:GH12342 n=1 Tax=Drosophila grimshawi TaxID=7222 RepID=B4JJ37_DROGR|nr:uncharacterized protein LOC6565398 [Drosophila grimshawi]EDV99589.1 GH12342 [Drosophila grimshawi]